MGIIKDVFGNGGTISKILPGYEERKQQLEYATSVLSSLEDKKHLVIEGPTGVGKSFGYLVPIISWLKKMDVGVDCEKGRAVIVTANIALQEQLVFKDLPLLSKIFGFSFFLFKGRNNYLCLDALATFIEKSETDRQGEFNFVSKASSARFSESEQAVLEWAKTTQAGDKSEMKIEIPNVVWAKFSKTASDCLKKRCPKAEKCFANKAKQGMVDSDIIVTNYHILFSSVKARIDSGLDVVLPVHSVLVLDEGHEAADIARDFFGFRITEVGANNLLAYLANQAVTIYGENGHSQDDDRKERVLRLAADVTGGISVLFSTLALKMEQAAKRKNANRVSEYAVAPYVVAKNEIDVSDLLSLLDFASREFKDLANIIGGEVKKRMELLGVSIEAKNEADRYVSWEQRLGKAARDALSLKEHLNDFFCGDRGNAVFFAEKQRERAVLRKSLLQVGQILREEVFEDENVVLVTSATLAIDGHCDFVRRELGVPMDVAERIVSSPFVYQRQAMLVVSRNAPDPKAQDFHDQVARAIAQIVRASNGRALCLFTSYSGLRKSAEYLRTNLPGFNYFVQGETSRTAALAGFKEDVSSVLLGTDSFWTGVDVPGETCSVVIIDRIPFPSPGDPVFDELCRRAGDNWFYALSLPRAILKIRQGTGRLIRRQTDKGIVVILDNRIMTKGYGASVIGSLPKMTVSTSLSFSKIKQFLQTSECGSQPHALHCTHLPGK